MNSSTKKTLIPGSVTLRTQNYRMPEASPEGMSETGAGLGGVWWSVYEYGGAFRNADEAERQAMLRLRRLHVENMRIDGRSGCTAFRAGGLVTVTPEIGEFLIVSVNHTGGISEKGGACVYTYNNAFRCIDSTLRTYAPPLTAAPPKPPASLQPRSKPLAMTTQT